VDTRRVIVGLQTVYILSLSAKKEVGGHLELSVT